MACAEHRLAVNAHEPTSPIRSCFSVRVNVRTRVRRERVESALYFVYARPTNRSSPSTQSSHNAYLENGEHPSENPQPLLHYATRLSMKVLRNEQVPGLHRS